MSDSDDSQLSRTQAIMQTELKRKMRRSSHLFNSNSTGKLSSDDC